MTAAAKFLFDTRFDIDAEPVVAVAVGEEIPADEIDSEPEVVVPPPPTFSEADLAAAREEAFAEGKAEGIREAMETTEAKLADAVATVGTNLEEILRTEVDSLDETARASVRIAAAIARKLFPGLNERNGLGEIERVIRISMERLREEHSIVIHVAEPLREPLSARIDGLAAYAGFQGKVSIAASEEIAMGDCRIEWASGGAGRDTAAIWRDIDSVLAENIGVETISADSTESGQPPGEPPTDSPAQG